MIDQSRLFILSAPSGAGKTTLVRRLMAAHPDLRLSVSHTTRAPRPGEVEGVSYYFVDEPTFRGLVDQGAFAEWFEVHGNLYGTTDAEVQRLVDAGHRVILDVDTQGGAALRARYPRATSLFVLPPSQAELEARLRGRGTEPEEVVRRRLANACGELGEALHYDYLVVNDDLDEAQAELEAVLRAGPLRTQLRDELVHRLLAERPE